MRCWAGRSEDMANVMAKAEIVTPFLLSFACSAVPIHRVRPHTNLFAPMVIDRMYSGRFAFGMAQELQRSPAPTAASAESRRPSSPSCVTSAPAMHLVNHGNRPTTAAMPATWGAAIEGLGWRTPAEALNGLLSEAQATGVATTS